MINYFDGEYYFLSNFYPCEVVFEGLSFKSSEAAFQAMKTNDLEQRLKFTTLNSNEAKKLGRKIALRKDWEQIKDSIMFQIVRAKFHQHGDLYRKLIATGEEELVEGNWWNDTYWGQCNGVGKNKLGKILMIVREELRSEV